MIRFNPLVLIMLASMGPYIDKSIGIRLEHVVIYSIFIWFILNNSKINFTSFNIFILLIISGIIPLFAEFFSNNNTNYSQIIAGTDNYMLFAAVFFISSSYFNKYKDPESFLRIVVLNLNILALNSIISLFSTTGLISNFLLLFHSTTLENIDIGVESVSVLAARMSRFSGIFDQPLEAGFAYSLGMLSLVYIHKIKKTSNTSFIFYSIMLSLGGGLTVSKVFIYGGLFLSIIYYCVINKAFISLILLSFPAILISYIALIISGGEDFFGRLLYINNIYDNIIFGRYNEGANILSNFDEIINNNLIFGLGYTGRSIYDSGYFQYFIQGGILELILQAFLLIIITLKARFKSQPFFLMIILTNILQLATLLGGPTILANRSSIYLAIIYACIANFNLKNTIFSKI